MSQPLVPTPQEKANQDACVGVSTALTVLSVIVVSLRIYTRTVIVGQIGKDDWAMLVALLFTITYLVCIFIMKNNGMGFGGRLLTMNQMTSQIQTTLAIEIIYYILINAIKISILFCYLRIAAGRKLAVLSKGTIYFLLTFGVVCVIVCLTQCIPLHKMWDLAGTVPGTCVNTTALFYTTSSLNILIDVWIIALPVPTLLQIQRPLREKMALIFVFGLGVFSCIASIVRLHSIRIYTESADPFYDSVPINLWSMVEVNVGIWCASIPSLKALFIRAQRERSKNASGGNGSYEFHSRGKSGVAGKMGSNSTGNGSIGTVIDNNAPEAGVKNGQDVRIHREWTNSEERILPPGAA